MKENTHFGYSVSSMKPCLLFNSSRLCPTTWPIRVSRVRLCFSTNRWTLQAKESSFVSPFASVQPLIFCFSFQWTAPYLNTKAFFYLFIFSPKFFLLLSFWGGAVRSGTLVLSSLSVVKQPPESQFYALCNNWECTPDDSSPLHIAVRTPYASLVNN